MSSGVTPSRRPPSVIAQLRETGVRMPMRLAVARDLLQADLQADLRVDGVVGERRRVGQRRHAGVGVLVVVDLEVAAVGLARDLLLLRRPRSSRARCRRAARSARTNGLNAEPGWRWPCVARLNGDVVVVAPADHRADLAGLVVDRDERGGRAGRVAEPAAARSASAARWRSRSSVVRIFRPPVNARARAVAVDDLLLDPRREVRRGLRRAPRAGARRRRAAPCWIASRYSPGVM